MKCAGCGDEVEPDDEADVAFCADCSGDALDALAEFIEALEEDNQGDDL